MVPCFTASREVIHNYERMLQWGYLTENPFWYFVMNNAPESLHLGYRTSLYGLVRPVHRCVCMSVAACCL